MRFASFCWHSDPPPVACENPASDPSHRIFRPRFRRACTKTHIAKGFCFDVGLLWLTMVEGFWHEYSLSFGF